MYRKLEFYPYLNSVTLCSKVPCYWSPAYLCYCHYQDELYVVSIAGDSECNVGFTLKQMFLLGRKEYVLEEV